jgi:hypothetical protein
MKLAASLLGVFLMTTAAHAGVARIWAVNDGEKVAREDLKNPNRDKNSAWDGKTIRIFGARNEVIAFQVIVESDGEGVANLQATLPELIGPNGGKIANAAPDPKGDLNDPTDYAGWPIQQFTAHYIQVKEPTSCHWIYEKNSPAAPPNPTGFKPIILVPQKRLALPLSPTIPLNVPPNSTQALWFEIYTARNLAPGVYKGTVSVTAGQTKTDLPLELELFDFTLPDQNSMKAMLYYEPDQVEHYQGANLDDRYHRFAHRQRIELVDGYDAARVTANLGRFNGKDFTPASRYEGPGQGVGNVIIPASFYGPGDKYDEAASAAKASDAWMQFLAKTVPGATTFLYLPDEPGRQTFPYILKLGQNVHSNTGPGGKLPLFVTHAFDKELAPAIDIWCMPTETFHPDQAAGEVKAGKQVWVYNGKRPYAGAPVYEAPATDMRATIWGCFKYNINLYFYWHCNHWTHNSQKPTDRDQNIWKDAVTFDNREQPNKTDRGAANGDGVMLYPGQEKIHPDQDQGIAGPCGSYQLANLRRGLQDHLYLTMARQLKLDAAADAAVRAVVGKMFGEADPKVVGFAQTGNEYEAARYKLVQAIAQAQGKKGE